VKALYLEKPGQLALIDVPMPEASADEVVVKVSACGICKSDIEAMEGTRPMAVTRYPFIPGHEWVGRVHAAGPGVRSFRRGDRVTAIGSVFCGHCDKCVQGFIAHCRVNRGDAFEEYGFFSDRPGGFAEFVKVPERLCCRVPGSMPDDIASLAEPASTVALGVLRSGLVTGKTVAVVGPGPIGLLAVAFYRLFNPARLIIIGTRDYRNKMGVALGADAAVNPKTQNVGDEINRLTDGFGPDVVFEAAGNPDAVKMAIEMVAVGGTVCLDGVAGGGRTLTIQSDTLLYKDITIRGILGYTVHSLRTGIDWMSRTEADLGSLITHRFALDEYAAAFDVVQTRETDPIKVLITP